MGDQILYVGLENRRFLTQKKSSRVDFENISGLVYVADSWMVLQTTSKLPPNYLQATSKLPPNYIEISSLGLVSEIHAGLCMHNQAVQCTSLYSKVNLKPSCTLFLYCPAQLS